MLKALQQLSFSEAILALALSASPLFMGAVHMESQVILAFLMLLSGLVSSVTLKKKGRPLRLSYLDLALLLALFWTLFQLLPLPPSWVKSLSPQSYEGRMAVAQIFALEPPAWIPLTVDLYRTLETVLSLITLLFCSLTVSNLRLEKGAYSRIPLYLEAAALGIAASYFIHQLMAWNLIFGLFQTVSPLGANPFVSGLVNPNHAAMLMMMGSLLALALSLEKGRARALHFGISLVLGFSVLLTFSRANILLLFLGVFILIMAAWLLHTRFESKSWPRLLLLLLPLVLLLGFLAFGPLPLAQELGTLVDGSLGSSTYLDVLDVSKKASLLSPWVGSGAGALSVLAPLFYEGSVDLGLLEYAHHGPLQLAIDLGWPVALLVMGLGLFAFVLAIKEGLSSLHRLAFLMVLLFAALQNLVDFSLWIPSLGLLFVALFSLLSNTYTEGGGRPKAILLKDTQLRLPLFLSGLLVLAFYPSMEFHPRKERKEAIAHARLSLEKPLLPVLERHPLDFQLYGPAILEAERQGDKERRERLSQEMLRLAPNQRKALFLRSRLAMEKRDWEEALSLLDRLANFPASLQRAMDSITDLPFDQRLMHDFYKAAPERAVRAYLLLVKKKRRAEALSLLHWAYTLHPDSELLNRWLGRALRRDPKGLSELATKTLLYAGTKDDKESGPWFQKAYLYEAQVAALEKEDGLALRLALLAADSEPETSLPALTLAGGLVKGMGDDKAYALLLPYFKRYKEEFGFKERSEERSYARFMSAYEEKEGNFLAAAKAYQVSLRGKNPSLLELKELLRLQEKAGDFRAAEATKARIEGRIKKDHGL